MSKKGKFNKEDPSNKTEVFSLTKFAYIKYIEYMKLSRYPAHHQSAFGCILKLLLITVQLNLYDGMVQASRGVKDLRFRVSISAQAKVGDLISYLHRNSLSPSYVEFQAYQHTSD